MSPLSVSRYAFLSLGFRPFYLLAALFALVSVPIWIAFLSGGWQWSGYLLGITWHSHEMVYGFAVAVMAGFLLTAVRNWTALPTASGFMLAGLASLWLAGRVLIFTGPSGLAAFVDLLFLPALALALAIPIWKSKNWRNLKILLVLLAFFGANILFHLARLGVISVGMMSLATTAALDLFTILMALVGGRVIPAFTANAIKSSRPRHIAGVEFFAFASLLLILFGHLLTPLYGFPQIAWLALYALASLAQCVRLVLWQPQKTRSEPLLMMLPLAYTWIPISLALRAISVITDLPAVAADHALTIGAMSGLMLAMMMRSALGHTGRQLVAGPIELIVFAAIQITAVLRLLAIFGSPGNYRSWLMIAAICWCLSFTSFLGKYWKVFTQPRIDGRVG